jgi:predicted SAM-dependent methyltransferase
MTTQAKCDRLHLGCGTTQPESWINLDGSWNAFLGNYPRLKRIVRALRLVPPSQLAINWQPGVIIHDLRKPLPFNDASMSAVYSSHTIEHLYPSDAAHLFDEIYRVLKPGGIVRTVVPDLEAIVLRYREAQAAGQEDPPPGDQLIHRLMISQANPPIRRFHPYALYHRMTDYHRHKWMYDAQSLMALKARHGFTDLARKDFLDSQIPGIEAVEMPDRVLNGAGVCVEGVKPQRL